MCVSYLYSNYYLKKRERREEKNKIKQKRVMVPEIILNNMCKAHCWMLFKYKVLKQQNKIRCNKQINNWLII